MHWSEDALIIVDMQKDFVLPTGSLYVPSAELLVPGIEDMARRFDFVVATGDWHTPAHNSFKEQGGQWPPHCVQQTDGAEFAFEVPTRYQGLPDLVVRKAQHEESYSAFGGTCLNRALTANKRYRLYVVGVATEYCVRSTVLDALDLGYEVHLVTNLIAGVNTTAAGDAEWVMFRKGAFPCIYEKD